MQITQIYCFTRWSQFLDWFYVTFHLCQYKKKKVFTEYFVWKKASTNQMQTNKQEIQLRTGLLSHHFLVYSYEKVLQNHAIIYHIMFAIQQSSLFKLFLCTRGLWSWQQIHREIFTRFLFYKWILNWLVWSWYAQLSFSFFVIQVLWGRAHSTMVAPVPSTVLKTHMQQLRTHLCWQPKTLSVAMWKWSHQPDRTHHMLRSATVVQQITAMSMKLVRTLSLHLLLFIVSALHRRMPELHKLFSQNPNQKYLMIPKGKLLAFQLIPFESLRIYADK